MTRILTISISGGACTYSAICLMPLLLYILQNLLHNPMPQTVHDGLFGVIRGWSHLTIDSFWVLRTAKVSLLALAPCKLFGGSRTQTVCPHPISMAHLLRTLSEGLVQSIVLAVDAIVSVWSKGSQGSANRKCVSLLTYLPSSSSSAEGWIFHL